MASWNQISCEFNIGRIMLALTSSTWKTSFLCQMQKTSYLFYSFQLPSLTSNSYKKVDFVRWKNWGGWSDLALADDLRRIVWKAVVVGVLREMIWKAIVVLLWLRELEKEPKRVVENGENLPCGHPNLWWFPRNFTKTWICRAVGKVIGWDWKVVCM